MIKYKGKLDSKVVKRYYRETIHPEMMEFYYLIILKA